MLAHMQLQRQCEAAAEECEQLRSQLDRQAAAAAEAQQQHAAELEASRSVVTALIDFRDPTEAPAVCMCCRPRKYKSCSWHVLVVVDSAAAICKMLVPLSLQPV